MKTYLTRILALAAVSSLLAMSGYATVIESVPYTIATPGTYTLDGNVKLAGTNQTAITVTASNVLIDLKGFTLTSATTHSNTGISIPQGTQVTVQNGVITWFTYGIDMSCSHYVVQNLQILDCTDGIVTHGISGSGEGLIQDCLVDGSGSQFEGIALGCNENVVKNNQVLNYFGPSGTAVFSNPGGNLFIGNSIFNCGYGLSLASGDKYQGNLTTFCGTPFEGGTAVGDENN